MQHLDEGIIHAWVDDPASIEAGERATIEQHLATCATCASALAEARGLIAASSRLVLALDDLPGRARAIGTAPVRKRWRRPSLFVGVPIATLLAASLVMVLLSGRGDKVAVPNHRTANVNAPTPAQDRVAPPSGSATASPLVPPAGNGEAVAAAARQGRAESEAVTSKLAAGNSPAKAIRIAEVPESLRMAPPPRGGDSTAGRTVTLDAISSARRDSLGQGRGRDSANAVAARTADSANRAAAALATRPTSQLVASSATSTAADSGRGTVGGVVAGGAAAASALVGRGAAGGRGGGAGGGGAGGGGGGGGGGRGGRAGVPVAQFIGCYAVPAPTRARIGQVFGDSLSALLPARFSVRVDTSLAGTVRSIIWSLDSSTVTPLAWVYSGSSIVVRSPSGVSMVVITRGAPPDTMQAAIQGQPASIDRIPCVAGGGGF